jgi:hypothetical protein
MPKSTLLLGDTGQAEEESVKDAQSWYLEDMNTTMCVHYKTLAIEFGRETEGDWSRITEFSNLISNSRASWFVSLLRFRLVRQYWMP